MVDREMATAERCRQRCANAARESAECGNPLFPWQIRSTYLS